MNDRQKEIAEKIIAYIKNKENKILKNEFFREFDFEPTDRVFILTALRDEYKLLKINGELYSLTKNGSEFISFKDLEIKENLEKEKIETELNLAKSNIRANELNEKNAKKNRTNTIINIIIGLLNFGALIWRILKSE